MLRNYSSLKDLPARHQRTVMASVQVAGHVGPVIASAVREHSNQGHQHGQSPALKRPPTPSCGASSGPRHDPLTGQAQSLVSC
jgi:hypothetical protein